MSKFIRVPEEALEDIRAGFEAALSSTRFACGKFSFSKTFPDIRRDARIHYTREAWEKQRRLIDVFDKEVAWHGIASRGEDENSDDYYISDILVYPQTVTGASVDMDEEAYAKWITDHLMVGDERFEHIYMQAHSHVRMATSPSPTDLSHQADILSQLKDDDFYIFMIWNKNGSNTIWIYDMKKNILFEDKDIFVVVDGEQDYDAFIAEAKSLVKDRVTTYYGGKSYPPVTPPYTGAPEEKKSSVPSVNASEKPRTRIDAGTPHKPISANYDDEEDEYLRRMYGDEYRDAFFSSGK